MKSTVERQQNQLGSSIGVRLKEVVNEVKELVTVPSPQRSQRPELARVPLQSCHHTLRHTRYMQEGHAKLGGQALSVGSAPRWFVGREKAEIRTGSLRARSRHTALRYLSVPNSSVEILRPSQFLAKITPLIWHLTT